MEGSLDTVADRARTFLHAVATSLPTKSTARANNMARDYAAGETLQSIGDRYGISRERVRQIINTTEWSVPKIKEARRILREAEERINLQAAVDQVRSWSYNNPGVPISQAAEELNMDEVFVHRALGHRRSLHAEETSLRQRKIWSDDRLIELIREFNAETGQTTSMAFEEWSVSRGGPTRQTPTNRFGSWANALEKAGIHGARTIHRRRRYSSEDLWAVVVEFFSKERESYSFQAFNQWLEESEGRPSSSLVRSHLQVSWARMAKVAIEVMKGGQGHDPRWVAEVSRPRNWSHFVDRVEPVQHVRDAIQELGTYITCVRYRDWARENNRPQVLTLMNHSGLSWSELVHQAGGVAGDRNSERIPTEELFAAMDDYAATGKPMRYEGYNAWAGKNDRPRAGTISSRFGGWREAVSEYRLSKSQGKWKQ